MKCPSNLLPCKFPLKFNPGLLQRQNTKLYNLFFKVSAIVDTATEALP